MLYIRGHPRDYDDWAGSGCEGWSWADVLPFFRKMERYEGGAWTGHGAFGGAFEATALLLTIAAAGAISLAVVSHFLQYRSFTPSSV